MNIRFKCHCGEVYDLPESMAGKKARCKSCRELIVVPAGQPTSGSTQPPIETQLQPENLVSPQPSQSPQVPQQHNVAAQTLSSQPNLGNELVGGSPHPLASVPGQVHPVPVMLPVQNQTGQSPANNYPYQQIAPSAYTNQQAGFSNAVASTSSSTRNKIIFGSAAVGVVLIAIVLSVIFLPGNSKKPSDVAEKNTDRSESNSERIGRSETSASETSLGRIIRPPGGDLNSSRIVNVPKTAPPRTSQHNIQTIASIVVNSKEEPSLVMSRNGQRLGMSEDRSATREVATIDFRSPNRFSIFGLYKGNTFRDISNDGKLVLFEDDGVTTLWQTNTGMRRIQTKGFPGRTSFSEDSSHIMIDDGEKSIVASCIGYGFQWVQKQSIDTTAEVTWTGDLRYGFYFEDGSIQRFDEMKNSTEVFLETELKDQEIVGSKFSRNAKFFLAFTELSIFFYDLENKKLMKKWQRNEKSSVENCDIANNGCVIAYVRPLKDSEGIKGEEVSLMNTKSGQEFDTIQSAFSFQKVFVSGTGHIVTTLSKKFDKDYHLMLWSVGVSLDDRKISINDVVFHDSIPEADRWHPEYKEKGFSIASDRSLIGKKMKPGQNNLDAFLEGEQDADTDKSGENSKD